MHTFEHDPQERDATPEQQRISSAVSRGILELLDDYSDTREGATAAVNGMVHALGFVTASAFCPKCQVGWMAFINRTVPQIAERARVMTGENHPCTH